MTPSPKELAERFGIDQLAPAQAAYRGAESARYFARGYRYGRDMPAGAPLARDHASAVSPLQAIAEAHTDGPGIYKWEHYFDIYDRHLSRFRGQDVRLLEIGVAGGGSLGMWREYLGPSAQICGIDVDAECKRFEGNGIEVVIGDQGNPAFWDSFLHSHEAIDIVIDDGGHQPEQQAVTLEALLPSISPGGVYVCEDIHGPFQPFHAFLDGLTRPLSAVGVAGETTTRNSLQCQVTSVHRYPILAVIEKAASVSPAFETLRFGTEWPQDWAR